MFKCALWPKKYGNNIIVFLSHLCSLPVVCQPLEDIFVVVYEKDVYL